MALMRKCSMCGLHTEVIANPVRPHIARCRDCRRAAAIALDCGEPISDPFAEYSPPEDPPVDSEVAATPQLTSDPAFIRALERGHARSLIRRRRRWLFGTPYYVAIVHGKQVRSDDEEELVAWIVSNY
jgi:hypothetical protein